MALFFPLTFVVPAEEGLVIMAVLYGSTTYGGSLSAIMVNVPGTGGSAATLLDGYPMAQRGDGAKAISISTVSSFFGAVFGLACLALFAPIISRWALFLGPSSIFLMAVVGLSTVSAVSGESIMKSVGAMSVGVVLSTVGVDPIRANLRFTFGTAYLEAGLNLIVVLIGIFAVSQSFNYALQKQDISSDAIQIQGASFHGIRTVWNDKIGAVRGSVIGTIVGSIPGAGISAANFLSYIAAVNSSKNPELFGTGKEEGLVAAETANNGSTMGALIPAMTLAIPGGAAAAVFIGVMITYGITPGPQAFDGTLPYIIFSGILIGDFVFLLFGLLLAGYIAKIIELPTDVLLASIVTLALVGAFAMRNNVYDVGAAIVIGIMGFFFVKKGYSLISFILGFILAPIAERGFQRSLLITGGDWSIFYDTPLNVILIIASIVLLLSPILIKLSRNR